MSWWHVGFQVTMMRNKVATIVKSAMDRAVSDTKAGITPPDQYLYADAILALEVEGEVIANRCKLNSMNRECPTGRINCYGCKHWSEARTATIADLVEVK